MITGFGGAAFFAVFFFIDGARFVDAALRTGFFADFFGALFFAILDFAAIDFLPAFFATGFFFIFDFDFEVRMSVS